MNLTITIDGALMKVPCRSTILRAITLLLGWTSLAAGQNVDFAHQVVPILRARCAQCHTDGEYKGGLSMDTRDALLDSGAIEPGDATNSMLIDRVLETDADLQMPPEGDRLTAAEIKLLSRWIDADAPWEEGFSFKTQTYVAPLNHRRPELPAIDPTSDASTNQVDRLLGRYWSDNDIDPQPFANDALFLRRVTMDLTGLLPSAQRVAAFVADESADKYAQQIDRLLADRQAYSDHWLTFWNDLLRNDYAAPGGRSEVTLWLYDSLFNNKPYDQFVRELIAPTRPSEGFIKGIKWRGNVNSSQTTQIQFAQNISQVFLGINLKCASCHDSFIDHWKLKDAYNLAAVTSKEPLELHRCDIPTGVMAEPGFLFPELGSIDAGASRSDRLKQLAALMTHQDNGRLTRTIVNRIWHRLMGQAIVFPVDSMGTQPFDEDLLDFLAIDLQDNDYDLKHTIALIASSDAYRRQAVTAPDTPGTEDYRFRGLVAKRMSAEQLVDSIWQVTGSGPAIRDAPISLPDAVKIQGEFIWNDDINPYQTPPSETFLFRKEISIDTVPHRVLAAITCDDGYNFYVNGKRVRADRTYKTVELVDVTADLKSGENTILIRGRNEGKEPTFAGVWCELRFYDADGTILQTVFSGEDWLCTPVDPAITDEGVMALEDPPYLPAAVVKRKGDAEELVARMQGAFAAIEIRNGYLIRAGLVKSDPLMRTLGRPNREQVVTTRPDKLSTLQALTLSNGKQVDDLLLAAARNKRSEQPEWDAPAMGTWLFETALSRTPTDQELQVIANLGGQPLTDQGAADVLWSVFMLPEFQIIY